MQAVFQQDPNQIAALVLEPMRFEHPTPVFIDTIQSECRRYRPLLIFDEMVTEFKFHAQGASKMSGAAANLYCWEKSLANGQSVAAVTGRRDVMNRASNGHTKKRVFFASSTHGAEIPQLAAMMKVLDRIKADPGMFERNRSNGALLRTNLDDCISEYGLADHVRLVADNCHFVVELSRCGDLGTTWQRLSFCRS